MRTNANQKALPKGALDWHKAELGARVQRLRIEANLSQRQAADLAGINQRSWGRLEEGLHFPQLDSLLRVQWALQLESIEELLGDAASARLLEQSAE